MLILPHGVECKQSRINFCAMKLLISVQGYPPLVIKLPKPLALTKACMRGISIIFFCADNLTDVMVIIITYQTILKFNEFKCLLLSQCF